MNGCRYEQEDRKCHHPKAIKEDGYVDWCVEGPCHMSEPDISEPGVKRCLNCISYRVEADADEEVEFGRKVYTGYIEEYFCAHGYSKKFNREGETDCKRYTERKAKCIFCQSIKPESELHKGYCSKECENNHVQSVEKSLKEDRESLTNIQNYINNNSELSYEKIADMQWTAMSLQNSIEQAADWLKIHYKSL